MKTTKQVKEQTIQLLSVEGAGVEAVKNVDKLVGFEPNNVILAQYSRVYLANQRQGNASSKTRAEVAGTTKKIYKQKGTGKARHGSQKAPIFKGGGVVGGPKPHEFRLSISKNQKKNAMKSAIAYQAQQGNLSVVDNGLLKLTPKTKTVQTFLNVAKLEKKQVLFVLPDAKAIGLIQSIQNLPRAQCTHIGELNAFEVLKAQHIVVIAEAFDALRETYFS